jgi:hypothetical protein
VVINGLGSFTMEGGVISGNTSFQAGGVSVFSDATSFSKTGGVIYGDGDNDPDNGNADDNTATLGNEYGHAVYYDDGSSNYYYRDLTLDEEDDISTGTLPTTAGAANTVGNWIKK